MTTIDVDTLNVAISLVLPLAVALVTKQLAEGWQKAVVLLALATLTGTATSIQAAGGTFDAKTALVSTVLSFVIAVATHFGLWKPVSLSGAEGKIAVATAGFGVGSSPASGESPPLPSGTVGLDVDAADVDVDGALRAEVEDDEIAPEPYEEVQ